MVDQSSKAAVPTRDSTLAIQALFFLRFVQVGSTVLAGYIACYFVWWHNRLRDDVPSGLIIFIFTSTFAVLEFYASSAHAFCGRSRALNYKLLLKSTLSSAVGMGIGYYALRHVPYIREWCEGDNWFRPTITYGYDYKTRRYGRLDPGVEQHNCALACDIIACGAIALAFTFFVAIFAAVGVYRERQVGGIKLEDEAGTHDYSDELLGGYDDIEKVGGDSDVV